MKKSLIIVESPAKAVTLRRILGDGYTYKASLGHIRDLPKSQLGVDIENNFMPKYVVPRSKNKIVRDLKKAAKVYESFLKEDPNSGFAANATAYLLSEISDSKRDLERALGLAKRALIVQPNDPSFLDTLGWVHYRMENYKLAIGPLEQALMQAPDSAIFNYHLGMVFYKLGQSQEARVRLEKALIGGDKFFQVRF